MGSTLLPSYKAGFLKSCLEGNVLTFGEFSLKSGRISPYYFNTGAFYRADLLSSVSHAFASAIHSYCTESALEFDVIFGPAYKGIPLAVCTVDALARMYPEKYGKLCYSFDRKELKDHGEGGKIVGSSLSGKRVLIVDDVVTAGSAKREAIKTIQAQGGEVAAIVVAMDRMEAEATGVNTTEETVKKPSAMAVLREEFGLPVIAVLTLDDIIDGLGMATSEKQLQGMIEYRNKYKAGY